MNRCDTITNYGMLYICEVFGEYTKHSIHIYMYNSTIYIYTIVILHSQVTVLYL